MQPHLPEEVKRGSRSEGGLIIAAASQGTGSDDEMRIRALLEQFRTEFIPFNRATKKRGFLSCLRRLRTGGFDLFVFEGTGLAVGLAAILGRIIYKRPYVFSSGDAVAPFLGGRLPVLKPLFEMYERMLYRCSSGFIGWTPYLAGRALTLGARRAMTAPGWAPYSLDSESARSARAEIRNKLGIPQDAVVFGLVGSLTWSSRYHYCYGAELVQAAGRAKSGVYVLVVGDGSGLPHLRALAGDALGKTIFLSGRVARSEVPRYLAAMDIGSLPQSVDGVGSFRYTTKLPEYLDVGLCIVMNEIPMAYDLDRGNIWRLPGPSPWSEQFLNAMAAFMDEMTIEQIKARRNSAASIGEFHKPTQVRQVSAFIEDIMRSQRGGVRYNGRVF